MKKKGLVYHLIRNKYVFTAVLFLVWMTFFANNDFFRQYRINAKKLEMTEELNRRKKLILETKAQMEQLKNRYLLEKFAREQYLFKKPNEEVFVIIEKEG